MENKIQTDVHSDPNGIFGVEEMLESVVSTPIHSVIEKIEDYGELCDSDCVDCD